MRRRDKAPLSVSVTLRTLNQEEEEDEEEGKCELVNSATCEDTDKMLPSHTRTQTHTHTRIHTNTHTHRATQ